MNPSCGGGNKMKKKKMESDGDADKISGLPDSILHVIFSSIDMKKVVQTSVLSRRWRNFWKSVPNLCFDASHWRQSGCGWGRNKPGKEEYDEEKAMNFVERVLLLRNEASNIRKLHLSFIGSDVERFRVEIHSDPYRILTWLNFACIRRVEEVYLENCFPRLRDSPSELPAQMFATLKVLELHSCGYIRLPTSLFSAPHLHILKLVSLNPSPHLPGGELVLSCPSLEELVLNYYYGENLKILNISAHQLKNLEIRNWDSRCEIKICTPNLTSLKLWSDSYKNYDLENLSSLVSCCIGGFEARAGSGCSLFCIQSLMKILNRATNVSTLEIYGYSYTRDKLPSEGVHDQLLNPFPNLTHLKAVSATGYGVRAMVNLLRCSPSIETLVWDAKEKYPCSESELEYWEKLLSFQYNFEGLKYVKGWDLRGTDNELKFLEFLLKNAVALKNVEITIWNWIQMDEKLNEFLKKLHSLPKASPRVDIFFSLTF